MRRQGEAREALFGFVELLCRRVVTRPVGSAANAGGELGRERGLETAVMFAVGRLPGFDRLGKQRCSGIRTSEAEGM